MPANLTVNHLAKSYPDAAGGRKTIIEDFTFHVPKGSFVTIRNGELWLNNLTLGAETARNIRLLATKKQIASLEKQKAAGMTIVPTKLLGGGRHIKLVIALGKGKKKYDKRETIKKRDFDRGRY